MNELKDCLKHFRKLNKRTQAEIAEFLNISAVGYGDYERGKSTPDVYSIIKLAKLYNISTDTLLGITEYNDLSTLDVDAIESTIKSLNIILSKIKK